MDIDHIFIFSNTKGSEADILVSAGFTEGSSRIHIGQGTTNRKFHFESFFLEVLWVHDQKEFEQEKTKNTQLWKYADAIKNNNSAFGLCLVRNKESDLLFKNAQDYQPDYFPKGKTIEFISKDDHLPWTFRLPFEGKNIKIDEPRNHKNKIKKLTEANFNQPLLASDDNYVKSFEHSAIKFKNNHSTALELTFDDNIQHKKIEIPELNLTIHY